MERKAIILYVEIGEFSSLVCFAFFFLFFKFFFILGLENPFSKLKSFHASSTGINFNRMQVTRRSLNVHQVEFLYISILLKHFILAK